MSLLREPSSRNTFNTSVSWFATIINPWYSHRSTATIGHTGFRLGLLALLHRLQRKLPQLPDMQDIAERSRQEIQRLDDIFAGGTVDQKKEFVAIYVKTIEADPNAKSVKISLFPALFSQIIAGGGFEPPTSGL